MVNDGKYVRVWEKYRPVLLNLMIKSEKEQASYKLSNHEFIDINPKKVSGYAFEFHFYQGKSANDIKRSLLAPDLLAMLKRSGKAMELSESTKFIFQMDKTFTIQVSSEADAIEEEAPEESSADPEEAPAASEGDSTEPEAK